MAMMPAKLSQNMNVAIPHSRSRKMQNWMKGRECRNSEQRRKQRNTLNAVFLARNVLSWPLELLLTWAQDKRITREKNPRQQQNLSFLSFFYFSFFFLNWRGNAKQCASDWLPVKGQTIEDKSTDGSWVSGYWQTRHPASARRGGLTKKK